MGRQQPTRITALTVIALVTMISALAAGCSESPDARLPASAPPAQTTGSAPDADPDDRLSTTDDAENGAGTLPDASAADDARTGVALDPVSGLPHFQGSLDVRIVAGTRVVGYRGCEPADPERGRVCSVDGQTLYLAYPESSAEVALIDATMGQNDEHTSWAVTLTVDDAKAVKRTGGFAVSVAGSLLFVGPDELVVLAHRPVTIPEPSIKNGRITFTGITKAEAWDLVESMETFA